MTVTFATSPMDSRATTRSDTWTTTRNVGPTSMWESLRQMFERLWRRSQQSSEQRRVIEARERFWAEVREGEREAEAKSVP
jgi:hypothetical protein